MVYVSGLAHALVLMLVPLLVPLPLLLLALLLVPLLANVHTLVPVIEIVCATEFAP